MNLGDVLNGSEILSDTLFDTAWLSQPCWQERLNLKARSANIPQEGSRLVESLETRNYNRRDPNQSFFNPSPPPTLATFGQDTGTSRHPILVH